MDKYGVAFWEAYLESTFKCVFERWRENWVSLCGRALCANTCCVNYTSSQLWAVVWRCWSKGIIFKLSGSFFKICACMRTQHSYMFASNEWHLLSHWNKIWSFDLSSFWIKGFFIIFFKAVYRPQSEHKYCWEWQCISKWLGDLTDEASTQLPL